MSAILSNSKVKGHSFASLPEVDLPCDFEDTDGEETRDVIEKAEARARARQRRGGSKILKGTNKQFAEALHQEADSLHHNGNYETALILYHRAARAYPRDISHAVAAQRTSAAITSATNPSRALKSLLPKVRNGSELAAVLCPESAALRALTILRESPNPSSIVSQIFQYFDYRKDFWRMPTESDRELPVKLARSRIMLRQLTSLASLSSKNLEASFRAGNVNATLRIGEELLVLAAALENPHRHRVTAHRCIALTYISMGRHDRAIGQVSRMIYSAKMSGDIILRAQSFVTLGKVHLAFGHLDAVARAWERLVHDIQESLPRAWLQHEIGRCYLEMGRHNEAFLVSRECLKSARASNSKKWLLHGKLLCGQALIKLGRFAEALEVLRVSARITEEEGDTPTLSYIRDLISRVSSALRSLAGQRRNGSRERLRKLRRRSNVERENQFLAVTEEKSSSSRKSKLSSRFRESLDISTDFRAAKGLVCSREKVEREEVECSSLPMRTKLPTEARVSKGSFMNETKDLEASRSISEQSISSTQLSPISEDPYHPDTGRTRILRREADSPDTSDSKYTGKTYVVDSCEKDCSFSKIDRSATPETFMLKHNLNSYRSTIPDLKLVNGFSNTVSSPESFRSQDTRRTFTVAHSPNPDSTLNIDESYESSTTGGCTKMHREFKSGVPSKEVEEVQDSFQIRNRTVSDNECETVQSYEKGELLVDTALGELVPTEKTCRTETPHSLYRHSLPTDFNREDLNENAAACQGFTTIFGPL
ncbi:tetratricopeptide repeat protein 25-like [Cephus cinctus]|uniref:Tetratricopeptide repeat protein 25-like n=1 Tax=Cephus cinctus TaxID=211228 RepID=A0AAJ7BGD5_CEPCN|nr:tetratricopeptide repeat protein 25-like [Cephus cinctus]